MTENFANFYATTLSAGINDSVTLVPVSSPVGSPDVDFRILIQDGENDATNRELVLVTAKSGSDFTVTRGIEGTAAVAHASGSYVAHVVTAEGFLQGIADRVANQQATIAIVVDGGGAVITTGEKADLAISFACVIDSWEILANGVGSIAFDIWKDTSYPPTNADSIVGSVAPTLSGAANSSGSDMTGWDGIIVPGDFLRFNVDSVSALLRATLLLHVTRS